MLAIYQKLDISRKKCEQSPTPEGVTPEFCNALGAKYPGSPAKNLKNALRLEIADKFERKAYKFSAMTATNVKFAILASSNIYFDF